MNPLLISAAIAAAIGFGSAWTWQGSRMTAAVNEIKLEQANERISIQRANRAALERTTQAVRAAQENAARSIDRVRADADSSAAVADGLHDTIAATVRSAADSIESCTRQVDALSVVFAQCTNVARTMAAEADSWAIQAVTLQDANRK